MTDTTKPKNRRGWQLTRRVTLILMGLGVTSEAVALLGMILGILAGAAFMATGETDVPVLFWTIGLVCCILRILCIRIDRMLQPASSRQSLEEVFFNELPERVSDAVTLIGFGFAIDSDPWLGLTAALAAIFSAYIRSIAFSRHTGSKPASLGSMTRIHRLILLSLTSILMISGVQNERFSTTIPQIALCVIIIGCAITVCVRWFGMKGIKV
ncbi:MAG TPA: hypothetical protein PK648_17735 [Verrucomicrobiales bacterium]|nr:hypothetical protein [Verrucomicrobiales bacterium]